MSLNFPFDPVERAAEFERLVMKDGKSLYYRFRAAPYYGGITTADAIGCSFICAYCWNYFRHLNPPCHGRNLPASSSGADCVQKKAGRK